MGWFNHTRRTSPARAPRPRLAVEARESRTVPYALTGGAWPHPELITLSFVPDGTVVASNGSGYVTSDLSARFGARFGSASRWQAEFLRAAQVWAQQTNLNFAVVADDGTPFGQGAYVQGDPGMGDVRIAGYNFGTNALASAAVPPPQNNYSAAGDVTVNTAQPFNIGSTYDLFTVAVHEIGHALGVGHATLSGSVMYPVYTGRKTALTADDVAAVRAVYGGARAPDAFDANGANQTLSAADNLTPLLSATTETAVVSGLDVTTTADVDYYRFVAPSGTSGTLRVTV